MKITKRKLLLGAVAATTLGSSIAADSGQATSSTVNKARRLVFPRDAGAHPEFKTEWWYITGHAKVAGQEAAYGFQITFFRSRVDGTQTMKSQLAAKQLLFAHAAITDVQAKHLHHDQRIARWSGEAPGQNGTDTASAATQDTGVV